MTSEKAVFIKLQHVISVWGPSTGLMNKPGLGCFELSFANESKLLLGAYDPG